MKKSAIAKLLVICLIVGLMGASFAATTPETPWWQPKGSALEYSLSADTDLTYTLKSGTYVITLDGHTLNGKKLTVEKGAEVYVNNSSASGFDGTTNLFYAVGKATIAFNEAYFTSDSANGYYVGGCSVKLESGATFSCRENTACWVQSNGTRVAGSGYVTWTNASSDSSSSSSGGSSTPATPDTPDTPAKDTEVEVKPETTTKEDGTVVSTATVDDKTAETMVKDAVENKSENVTVTVDAPANATEVEANIPASAVKDLASKTDADLTVATPVANVTLPNEALADLGSSTGTVTVTAAKTDDDTVQITVAKNGNAVDSVKGGIKVAVPVEEATTGTVAVLVNADGTETVIKKSVAVDGEMIAPLDGSATIKMVDNSKSFADSDAHWGKASVDFVTSRGLFLGTSETTFEPNTKMNRAMLVTVLHRLEDTPVGGVPAFGDVNSGAWYTDAVAWASKNNIVNGYANGDFGPSDDVTREQIATILYRYAVAMNIDTPESGSLSRFADGSSTSDWAKEAMEWAVGAGLFQGNGGNLNPKSPATRAEVATLLMRFVEYMA